MIAPLSILCVTQAKPYAERFLGGMAALAHLIDAELVIAADGAHAFNTTRGWGYTPHLVHCTGPSLEEVLDEAVSFCARDYVLRLDDDETFPDSEWLPNRHYLVHDNWSFATYNLWQDERHYLANAPLYPDVHTRLATKEKSGGRTQLHAGSPWGVGELAPVAIRHHKFLVRNYEQRRATAEKYEAFHEGFGLGFMKVYTLPEDVIPREQMDVKEIP